MLRCQTITPLLAFATAMFAGGCATRATDPFNSGPGRAAVQGAVYAPDGSLIPGTTVSIACPGQGAIVVSTNASGYYASNLSAAAQAVDQNAGRVSCRFTEPATGIAHVQLDTALGFARGPVLVALQTVNLHER
jgi:hypothetical protein